MLTPTPPREAAASDRFSGNVVLHDEAAYAPSPASLEQLKDAADSEFPNVIDVEPPCPQS